MKREDLTKLGLTDESVLDAIMALHGKDIESHKAALITAQSQVETLTGQLKEAGATIESFKAMKPEELKAAADDYKAKFEQAQADATKQVAALKFDHALDSALSGAKARNPKAVKALLDAAALKYNEADGSIIGLKEQLEKVKSENDYLFADETPTPKIVAGGKPQTTITDALQAAVLRGAGIAPK